MAQRNVEWYSVHTNGVELREMTQRNVEDSLHVTPQASSTIRQNFEIFQVILSNLMFR